MKNYINIILLLGVLLMALSCVGTEGLDEIPNGEICMSPVLSDMTKTRAGGATNPYPDGSSFGVFAYYSTTTGGQKWSEGGESYFQNHQFKNQDGVCAGVGPVYWPLSGSLIFAGYSPYDQMVDVSYNSASNTLVINECVLDGTKDLMYFVPELDEGQHIGYGKQSTSIPVCFHHALSAVSFSMLAGVGNATVKLKEIKLSSVYHKADFSVTGGESPNWTNKTDNKDLVVWSPDNGVGVDLSSESIDAVVYTIPGDATGIYITYQIEGNSDKTICLEPEDYISEWEVGKINQYDISINSIEEVVIDPTVEILPKYEGDMLTGSVVNVLDLGLSQEELDRIKDLKIFVKDSEDFVYKSYADADNVANAISFDSGEKLYVPSQNGEKEYYVNFSYHDGLGYQTVTKTVKPEKPDVTCHISYVTLLNELRIRKAYVTISDDVLEEVKMTYTVTAYPKGGAYVVNKQDVEYGSSCFMNETSISLNQCGSYMFGQTYVKFDGVVSSTMFNGQENKNFTVPSSYSIGERVELASNLEPNVKYALSLDKDYSASSRLYWSSNPGYLAYQSFYSTTNDSVFLYERDDSQKDTKASEYNFSSAGAWISAYDFKYVDANFWFSTTPTYFTCASVWGTEDYDDNKLIVDIYCNSKSAFINRYDWGYSWNITGNNTSYKWNVYKVIDNY